ncbi:MAG: phosphotransferase family protein [Acidimicrobiales bacterium]
MTDPLADALGDRLGGAVDALTRLSGGASRETWSFRLDGRPLIVQRRRTALTELGADAAEAGAVEADLLAAAAASGVPVPVVVDHGDGDDGFGAPWLVSEHVEGESLPRRLLGDEAFAAVRGRLAFECGAALARIHSIDPAPFVGRLPEHEPVGMLYDVLDLCGAAEPALELGLRWLRNNPPAPRPQVVVHGDFRTGNLLVRPDADARPGLAAVLDWELAHLGAPAEDLGWFCARAWRFGSPLPAGGVGSVDDLLAGYHSVAHAGAAAITVEEVRWWELLATLRWGVICVMQAQAHLGGVTRSVELATIGRRTCEAEFDALTLLDELAGSGP